MERLWQRVLHDSSATLNKNNACFQIIELSYSRIFKNSFASLSFKVILLPFPLDMCGKVKEHT